jgi:hypothetical protein
VTGHTAHSPNLFQVDTDFRGAHVRATPGYTAVLVSMLTGVALTDIFPQDVLATLFRDAPRASTIVPTTGRVRLVAQCGGVGVEMDASAGVPDAVAYAHCVRVELRHPPGWTFASLGEAPPYAGHGIFASVSEVTATTCKSLIVAALDYCVRHVTQRPRWEYLLAKYG